MSSKINITPLPGYCLVMLESAIARAIEGIEIPEEARQAAGFVGIVFDANPLKNEPKDLIGQRIIASTSFGSIFPNGEDRILRYPIRHIVAIAEHDCRITVNRLGEYGVARCRHCKSKGEGNIMLDGNGMCPVCGIDDRTGKPWVPKGEPIKRPDGSVAYVTASEDQKREFGGLYPHEINPKGTIFSYTGQRKR